MECFQYQLLYFLKSFNAFNLVFIEQAKNETGIDKFFFYLCILCNCSIYILQYLLITLT